jgi:monoamine oxidase
MVRGLHGEKTLSALVTRIERRQEPNGSVSVRVHYQRDRRMYAIDAERVVLAVPFWRLHQIEVIPPLSSEKWQAVQSLSRGQYTVVHMLMSPPKEIRQLWLVDGKNPFSVLSDGTLGVIYGMASAQPKSAESEAFSLLIHGQYAAAFHMVPRELRLHDIYGELEKLWPGFTQFVKESYVYTYHPGAIPVWPPGRSPLDELSQKLRQPELGLYLAGDYLYNAHSDGAARSGIAAAERIAAEFGIAKLPRPALFNRQKPPPRSSPAGSDSRSAAPPRPLPAPRPALRRGSSAAPGSG